MSRTPRAKLWTLRLLVYSFAVLALLGLVWFLLLVALMSFGYSAREANRGPFPWGRMLGFSLCGLIPYFVGGPIAIFFDSLREKEQLRCASWPMPHLAVQEKASAIEQLFSSLARLSVWLLFLSLIAIIVGYFLPFIL